MLCRPHKHRMSRTGMFALVHPPAGGGGSRVVYGRGGGWGAVGACGWAAERGGGGSLWGGAPGCHQDCAAPKPMLFDVYANVSGHGPYPAAREDSG